MGGTAGKLPDDEVVRLASLFGLKVYSGFKATERRLIFEYGDNFKTSPTLFTVLANGTLEGPKEGKPLAPTKQKGLITFPYAQSISREIAEPHFMTNVVWQEGSTEDFALVQTWTVNINDEFREAFVVKKENPDPKIFEPQAVKNFYIALELLFGEEARQVEVQYCTKETQNIARTFVGTHTQMKCFLRATGVADALNVKEVQDGKITVITLDKKGNQGTKDFPLSNTDVPHVLYQRKGYTSFMCIKTLEQFETDSVLYGEIPPD